jgi:hypothetical protein
MINFSITDPNPGFATLYSGKYYKTLVVHPFSCVQGGKKGGILGVGDSKLSASINDATGIKCSHIGVIPEVRKTLGIVILFFYFLFYFYLAI